MLVGEARRGPSAPAHSLPGSGPGWEEALPCLCGGQRHGLDRAPTTFSRLQAVFHFVGHTPTWCQALCWPRLLPHPLPTRPSPPWLEGYCKHSASVEGDVPCTRS